MSVSFHFFNPRLLFAGNVTVQKITSVLENTNYNIAIDFEIYSEYRRTGDGTVQSDAVSILSD